MDQEQLLTRFYEVLTKKSREADKLINTFLDTVSVNPKLVEDSILYILQQSFKQKQISLINEPALIRGKHTSCRVKYTLLLKILSSISSSSTLSAKKKSEIFKKIKSYTCQCSRSTDKSIRLCIIDFLIILKSGKISFFEESASEFKDCIGRLIVDKNLNVRRQALRLASLFEMNNAILEVISSDPIPIIRKSALGQLSESATAGFEVEGCLDDPDQHVRLGAVMHIIKHKVTPASETLRKLFLLMKSDRCQLIKDRIQVAISDLMGRIGHAGICEILKIEGSDGVEHKYQHSVVYGLFKILEGKVGTCMEILHRFFERLVNEKEKMDLGSLLLLRIAVSVIKSKDKNIREIIDKYNLQEFIPKILVLFLNNKEDYQPDYFFKLQNMIMIAYIDVDEGCREEIINTYLTICEKIPIYRYNQHLPNEIIDKKLIESYKIQGPIETMNYFAKDEEDVISCIVEIIREIYRDSEHSYIASLKHKLIDNVVNGAIYEEGKDGPVVPLIYKLEKNEKKLKKCKEDMTISMQSGGKDFGQAISLDDFDEKCENLEKKKKKYYDAINEKYYRGLLIIAYVLKHAEIRAEIHPDYLNIIQNFIKNGLTRDDLYIQWLSYVSLGYACLLSNELSEIYTSDFRERLLYKYKIIEITSIRFLFDILMCIRNKLSKVCLDCIRCLRISLNNWHIQKCDIILAINVEGFCKLLLRKVITNSRSLVIAKLFDVYFNESVSRNIQVIAKAFFANYSGISEELCIELANGYLIYLVDKQKSGTSLKGLEEKSIEIIKLFDPQVAKGYEQTENVQFLIFYFCNHRVQANYRFYLNLIQALNFGCFKDDMGKFVKDKMDILARNYSKSSAKIHKCLKELPNFSNIVEDISYREYDLSITDIESQAERFEKEKREGVIYS